MQPSKLSKDQAVKILKTAAYISISASLDYLISTLGQFQFGVLTPVINLILVSLKQYLTKPV